MALFGKKQEVDPNEKAKKVMQQYNLEDISMKYVDALTRISYNLAGSELSEFAGLLTSDDKAVNRAQTQYIHTIMEQNFIIIRQLDELINLMKQK